MKKFICLASGLLICSVFMAQTKEAVDPKAKSILDALSAKTKSYTSIKAEFTVVIQGKDKTKKPEIQKGMLQLKGDKYKLEIKGQEIISDGKTTNTFLKDNNELQINNVDPDANEGLSPTSIFTIYEKGFKYKFNSESQTSASIDLYPLKPDKKKFHTLRLTIDKAKNQIVSCEELMKDGSTVGYTLNSFTSNLPLSDELFTFDTKAHPGVEIIDLREH